jgi:23S rRNA (adenine-N6)-dimethyltransferase
MSKRKIPVRFTGQHFTVDKKLILKAIQLANISPNDTVLDIGAGKGFLTVHLAGLCHKTLAIENDLSLVKFLRQRFLKIPKVSVVGCDFRDFMFPTGKFKVVANIPYGISAEVLRSLMYEQAGKFTEGTIVMQHEAALKLCNKTIHNPLVALYRSFYKISIIGEVSPESFVPPPRVKSALVHLESSLESGIPVCRKKAYLAFLTFMLQKPKLPVITVLKQLFRKTQVRQLSRKYLIDLTKPTHLMHPREFSACFREMDHIVPKKYHPGRRI